MHMIYNYFLDLNIEEAKYFKMSGKDPNLLNFNIGRAASARSNSP